MSASAGKVRFIDQGKFIQVVNGITGVTAFVSKIGIIIRQDNADSFFIKNDSYIDYFTYATVETPVADFTAELVGLLVTMAQNIEDLPSLMENVKNADNILEITTPYDKNSFEVDELAVFDASGNHDSQENYVVMGIAQTLDSRIVRQSKEYVSIPTGKNVIALVNGALVNNTATEGVVSRIGMFDDANDVDGSQTSIVNGYGIYFKYDSSTYASQGVSLVLRTTTAGGVVSETEVFKDDWNIDTADSSGVSMAILDPTKLHTFVFSFGNSMGMNISAGILFKGRAVTVHEFSVPDGYNFATRVPMRWEISALPGSVPDDVATMIQKNGSVYSSNKQMVETRYYSASTTNDNNNINYITTVGQSEPIMSIRLKPSCVRGKIKVKGLNLLNTSTGGVGRWELRMNSNLTGANFLPVNSYSFAEKSEVETNYADGTVIASGYISDVSEKHINLNDSNKLLASIIGRPDVLTLVVHLVQGSLNIHASLEWSEFE